MGRQPKTKWRDVVNAIPWGKAFVAIWDFKGGTRTKIILFLLVSAIGCTIYELQAHKVASYTRIASTTGNGSPVVNNAASTSGNGSPVYQNAPGGTINLGVTPEQFRDLNAAVSNLSNERKEEMRLQITSEMETSQRTMNSALTNLFPLGYALFTATEGHLVVPFKSDINRHLIFHWETGCAVSMTSNTVKASLPSLTINTATATDINLGAGAMNLFLQRHPGFIAPIIGFVDTTLEAEVLNTNLDRVMIAVGLRPKSFIQCEVKQYIVCQADTDKAAVVLDARFVNNGNDVSFANWVLVVKFALQSLGTTNTPAIRLDDGGTLTFEPSHGFPRRQVSSKDYILNSSAMSPLRRGTTNSGTLAFLFEPNLFKALNEDTTKYTLIIKDSSGAVKEVTFDSSTLGRIK